MESLHDIGHKIANHVYTIIDKHRTQRQRDINSTYTHYITQSDIYNQHLVRIMHSLSETYAITCTPQLHIPIDKQVSHVNAVQSSKPLCTQIMHSIATRLPDAQRITHELNDEIQKLERNTHTLDQDYSNLLQPLDDDHFISALQQFLVPQPHSEYTLYRILNHFYHEQTTTRDVEDIVTSESQYYYPHPDILYWCITQRQDHLHDFGHILQWWYALWYPKHTPNMQYHDVITKLFSFRRTYTDGFSIAHIPPTHEFKPYDLSYLHIDTPMPSPIIKESSRSRRFGTGTIIPYTYSYYYEATEFSLEHNQPNEDTLLFSINEEDFFVVVCDGVSQACLSDIASRNVAQQLYIAWQTTLQQYTVSDQDDKLSRDECERLIKNALNAAKQQTAFNVHHKLEEIKSTISENIVIILRELNAKGGSQSIFSCVFSYQQSIYCLWMGNSAISLEGNTSGKVLSFTDPRFSQDSDRFSSTAQDGMRGRPHIEIYEKFMQQNTEWRVCIHSDALEEYPDRENTIYAHPLQKPAGRPLGAQDDLLFYCREKDDTTIIELYKNNSTTLT